VITGRALKRDEVELVWKIDRSEVIASVYYLEADRLILKLERYEMTGWPPGEAATYTPLLLDCYDHGGWFYGLFDQSFLVGVAVLESRFIGRNHDLLQLKFMHVSSACRGQGVGHRLFNLAAAKARILGAKGLYISATPSENTVNFYLRLGCVLTHDPDPELLRLEPEDIHLEYAL
jgi:predicted N-acetyltransferase YhbS